MAYDLPAIIGKAANMEAGGMTHNAACIEAVKTMYPKDYSEILVICKENGLNPEAEIPGLIDALEADRKQAIKTTAEKIAMTKNSPGLEGLNLLLHFAGHNCGIRPFFEIGTETPENFTTDKEKISAMWEAGNRIYKVYLRGYMVIDIDRNHKSGIDGLDRFYAIYDKKRLPSTLQNISAFPCHVETPSGGFHLYFKYTGNQLQGKHNIDPTIEIKTKTITAPIIHRNGKPYIWRGSLDNAPRLYPIIREKIPGIEPERAAADKPITHNKKKYIPQGGNPLNPFNDSLASVYDYVCTKYGSPGDGNRNQFCYYFGIAAGKKGFSETEIYNYLESTPANTDDIRQAVKSALKSQAVTSAIRG